MNDPQHGLLTLIAPQSLEEELVDFFLDSEHQHGFTSLQVHGHSLQHGGLSVIEQVTGRQQKIQFQVLVDESEARDICQRLKAVFSDAGIHFWLTPTVMQGRI